MTATAALDPVLGAITSAAVTATGASGGWLLAVDGERLRVVAVAGDPATRAVLDATIPAGSGSAGYVAQSGQPLATAPRDDDARFDGGTAALSQRRPTSVLSVPASTDDGVAGVLELVDKAGGGGFSFDDVEVATLLADIAGVAIAQVSASSTPPVPGPAELGGDLERLAAADPARYSTGGAAVAALLARG